MQHSLPGLEAGKYTVTAQQQIVDSDSKDVTDGALPVVTHSFGVEGPKYTVASDLVHSFYPPAGAQGEFSTALPQIVLKNAEKLPWIRSPYYKDEPEITTHTYKVGGKDYFFDDDKATWLFILLLSQTDFAGTSPKHLIKQGTVADIVPDTMKVRKGSSGATEDGKLPSTTGYSSFSYVFEDGTSEPAGTVLDPGIGHDATTSIRYIDVPVALFEKLAPTMQDLGLMAHVRSVRLDNKAIPDSGIVDATGEYAVLMGNRLPQSLPASAATNPSPGKVAAGANDAFVVSLENLECALRGYTPSSYFKTKILSAKTGFVRLVILNQWSFTSYESTSFDFQKILENLNGRVPDATNPDTTPQEYPRLRLPNPPSYPNPTPAQNSVETMLSLGYVPMNHLTRVPDTSSGTAEPIQTMSWYRGPLTPFAVAPDPNGPLGGGAQASDVTKVVYSADALLRFDPELGLYDTSYASAWQLGRLLALQDKTFSTAYYQWQRSQAFNLRAAFELQTVSQDFAVLKTATSGVVKSTSATNRDTLYKTAMEALVGAAKKRGNYD